MVIIMNFDEAIAAHIKWKIRLIRLIEGTSNEKLSSETVSRDNLCDLGKWLYGEGSKYKSLALYQDLLKKHAKFHVCAGEVIKKVELGDLGGADAMRKGPYDSASKDTINAITKLKNAVNSPPK